MLPSNSMTPTNTRARAVAIQLQQLAHVSTDGVRVSVLVHCCPVCYGNARVCLPACLFDADMADILRRTWRHELQHARDLLDGLDLPIDAMEQRARRAELLP